jgi:hypothetical protein
MQNKLDCSSIFNRVYYEYSKAYPSGVSWCSSVGRILNLVVKNTYTYTCEGKNDINLQCRILMAHKKVCNTASGWIAPFPGMELVQIKINFSSPIRFCCSKKVFFRRNRWIIERLIPLPWIWLSIDFCNFHIWSKIRRTNIIKLFTVVIYEFS